MELLELYVKKCYFQDTVPLFNIVSQLYMCSPVPPNIHNFYKCCFKKYALKRNENSNARSNDYDIWKTIKLFSNKRGKSSTIENGAFPFLEFGFKKQLPRNYSTENAHSLRTLSNFHSNHSDSPINRNNSVEPGHNHLQLFVDNEVLKRNLDYLSTQNGISRKP